MTERALIVPDDVAWRVWGADPYADGLRPVSNAGSARRVLLPDRLPGPLGDALRRLAEDLPPDRRVEVRAAPGLDGRRLESVLAARSVDDDDGGREDDGHQHGEHGDMMAITGSPGPDGLVMEPIETTVGPLAGPLPGGLAVSVCLEGEVVEECRVDALLHAQETGTDRLPDALVPAALAAALASRPWPPSPWASAPSPSSRSPTRLGRCAERPVRAVPRAVRGRTPQRAARVGRLARTTHEKTTHPLGRASCAVPTSRCAAPARA
ncbi:MAG TPA: hypothetical protein VGW11_08255 [Solirubrobacteraceae bacterium]|nr:hypothetical protein [Solirubrobacteraceae bacterium]